MLGLALRFARPYFVWAMRTPTPTSDVTTSRSVVHVPWGSTRIVNVRPCSSTLAGSDDVIVVSRLNVSRS